MKIGPKNIFDIANRIEEVGRVLEEDDLIHGARVLSELATLRWDDIDLDAKRMRVLSPKTERQGKPSRMAPILPEVIEALQGVTRGDSGLVFAGRVCSDSNVRKWLLRAIQKAGLASWPRLFHNMRASLQTDLVAAGFPPHVVCAWMGNTKRIADDHYLMVSDADWKRATDAKYDATQGRRQAQGDATSNKNAGETDISSESPALDVVRAGIVTNHKSRRKSSRLKTHDAITNAPARWMRVNSRRVKAWAKN